MQTKARAYGTRLGAPVWITLAVTAAAGAECGGGSSDPRASGTSSFSTPAPRTPDNTSGAAGSSGAAGAAGEAGAPGEGGASSDDVPDFPEAIEPGDFVDLVGTQLTVLNRARGLQIIDVAAPDRPRLLATLPFPGSPRLLVRRGTRAFVLVDNLSDPVSCSTCPGGVGLQNGLVVFDLDLADPAAPRVVGRAALTGALQNARLFGEALHVVTVTGLAAPAGDPDKRYRQAVGLQVVTAAAEGPRVASSRLLLPPGSWLTAVALASDGVTVAASGHGTFDSGKCVLDPPGPREGGAGAGGPTGRPSGPKVPTMCSLVRLLAAGGAAATAATVDLEGQVAALDRHGGDLRVVIAPAFAFDPQTARPMRVLVLRGPSLTAAGQVAVPLAPPYSLPRLWFAGSRLLVFPSIPNFPGFPSVPGVPGESSLIAIDLGDPAHAVVGRATTKASLHPLAVSGSRVLALQQPTGCSPSETVMIFDVGDAAHPTVVASVEDQPWPGGVYLAYLPQANLLVMPWREGGPALAPAPESGGWRGMLLYDVDLAQGTLTRRGRLETEEVPARALASASGDGLWLVSDARLVSVDARDRAAPREVGALELGRNVSELVTIGETVVEVVKSPHPPLQFDLVFAPAANPGHGAPAGRLGFTGYPNRLLAGEGFVYLLWTEVLPAGGWANRMDIIEPGAPPRRRGSFRLPQVQPFAYGGEGAESAIEHSGVWRTAPGIFVLPLVRDLSCGRAGGTPEGGAAGGGGGAGASSGSATTGTRAGGSSGCSGTDLPPARPQPLTLDRCGGPDADFLIIDARNPDAPRAGADFKIAGADAIGGAVVAGTTMFVNHREDVTTKRGGELVTTAVRYYVTPVDLASPKAPRLGAKVSVPGPVVAVDLATQSWTALSPAFDPSSPISGEPRAPLGLSSLYWPAGSARAYLEGQRALAGHAAGFAVDGRTLWVALDGRLVAVDLSQPKTLPVLSRTEVPAVKPTPAGAAAPGRPGEPTVAVAPGEGPFEEPDLALGRVVARHALIRVGWSQTRLVDVRDPMHPLFGAWVYSPGGVVAGVPSADGARLFVVRRDYGVATLSF